MAWCVSRDEKTRDPIETTGMSAARRPFPELRSQAESGMPMAPMQAEQKQRQPMNSVETDKTDLAKVPYSMRTSEFIGLVRAQLDQILQRQNEIVQRQEQQFELLQKGQSRLHQGLDTLQQTAREQQTATERLTAREERTASEQPPRQNSMDLPMQPNELWRDPSLDQRPQRMVTDTGIKINGISVNTVNDVGGNACKLRDPEVLEDTLHDLIGEVREEYAKLKELRKGDQEDGVDNKQVIATQMKQMRESLDRTLLQVSAWAPKAEPMETAHSAMSLRASGSPKGHRKKLGKGKSAEHIMLPHVSRAASAEELDEKMDMLLGNEVEKNVAEDDFLQRLVKHKFFELFFGTFILLNTLVMAVEMQYSGMVAGANMEFYGVEKPAPWIEDMLGILDKVFLIAFTLELVLKILGLRKLFWYSAWNFLDFVIVAFGILESLSAVDIGLNPMMLRLVRLVKLTRFAKMFRMAGHLFVLNLIMKSVSATISTLCWSMLLLAMVQAVFGMLVGQLVYGFLTDPHGDQAQQQAVYKYYGTFTRTMFTMFEITHVNYSRAARVLTDNISENWAWFFVGYRCLVGFAVLQVIRAVFIQQTLKVADNDKELRLMNLDREKKNLVKKLGDVFNLLDIEGLDSVGVKEFKHILQIPRMQVWLSALDMDSRDPEMLFRLLDLNGDGSLSREEFIHGAAKLRGHAQSIDLFQVFDMTVRLQNKIDLMMPEHTRAQADLHRSTSVLSHVHPDHANALHKTSIADCDMSLQMEEVTAASMA